MGPAADAAGVKPGRAGWLEVELLEGRRVGGTSSRVIVDLGSDRRETEAVVRDAAGVARYNATLAFPVDNVTDQHVSLKVVAVDVLGEALFGRASIPLKFLMKEDHTLQTWIELLPPHRGETLQMRGSKVRALSPAVYKAGLPKTMERPSADPGFVHVKLTWHGAPCYYDMLTTDWDWGDTEAPDAMDWFGNLFVAHGARIGAGFHLPCAFRALRAAPLNTRLLALSVYMMLCLVVQLWMVPMILFAAILANSLYYHHYEEPCVTMIPLYEEANEIPAPTIFETLSQCSTGALAAPAGAQAAQDILGQVASHVERVAHLFTISDNNSRAPFVLLLAACAGLSSVLYYIPVRILLLPMGAAALLAGTGADAPAAPAPTPDASPASSPRSASSAADAPPPEPAPRRAAARLSPGAVFLQNVWLYTPDLWETVHRRVSRMQMVSKDNVPAAFK